MVAKQAEQPEPEVMLQRRHFSADEYERMIEAGILRDDERLELLIRGDPRRPERLSRIAAVG